MSTNANSSGSDSVSWMEDMSSCSSAVASGLALYCSTGMVSGPGALPDLSFLTHSLYTWFLEL